MEYVTTYPKTISFLDGLKHKIEVDSKDGVEQLHIVVKKSFEPIKPYNPTHQANIPTSRRRC